MKRVVFNKVVLFLSILLFCSLSLNLEGRAGGGGSSSSSSSSGSRSSFHRRHHHNGPTTPLGLFVNYLILGFICWKCGSKLYLAKKSSTVKKDLLNSNFSRPELNEAVRKAFKNIQKSWSDKDYNTLKEQLTPWIYFVWKIKLSIMEKKGLSNIVKDARVYSIEYLSATNYHGRLGKVKVLLSASCQDLTYKKGELIETGDSSFEEIWIFDVSPRKQLRLKRIQQVS